MKNIIYTFLMVFFVSTLSFSQDCEGILRACKANLKKKNNNFLSDGQVYTAFLDREKAEFKTTFFGGSTYRISASAGTSEDFVIFTIKDLKGNVIFTNKDYKNAPYWDFKIPVTLPVVIETELDMDKKITGCAVMLIGFKQ